MIAHKVQNIKNIPYLSKILAHQGCHGQGKKSGKFFQVREKSGNLDLSKGNWKKLTKVREFQNFLKTEMAMAVSLIFRNINLQNWPHSFVK